MSCTYYRWSGGTLFGDYWCDKKDCRVDDKTYKDYCRGYNYTNCPIYKRSDSSSPCFITTIACQILGKEDNDQVLNTLRNFRNNILQNNEKYYDLLKDYDNIGPIIADCIYNDKDREEMATGLYNNVIVPISKQIENKEYDKAIFNYEIMTLALINYYGLKKIYNLNKEEDYYYNNFDPKTSGHGVKKKVLVN